MGAAIYYILFGILTAVGGVMGWVRARSKASLIAGLASGVVLAVAGIITMLRGLPGHWVAAVVSAMLLVRFGPAWVRGKPMPGAPMTILSVLGLIISAWAISAA